MTTSSSLYNAVYNDDFSMITNGAYADYGFLTTREELRMHLFGAYQCISKFLSKDEFSKKLHTAYINEDLHNTVNTLITQIPVEFQKHWNDFINNGGKISPIYI